MSVDSTVFDRSILEGKDRDALRSIAEQLGEKPGSRARKADIIDLILDKVGVSAANGDDASKPDDRTDAKPDSKPAAADEKSGSSGDGVIRSSGTSGKPDLDEVDEIPDDTDPEIVPVRRSRDTGTKAGSNGRDTSDAAEGKDDQSAGQDQGGQDNEGGQDRGGQDKGNQNKGGQDKGGQDKGNQNKGNQNKGGQDKGNQNKGNQNKGDRNQNQQNQPGEGNRRKRRRGRNRGGEPEDQPFEGEPVPVEGFLDLRDEGYGFLRTKGFLPTKSDVYLSVKQVRQFGLRKGDHISGASRPANRNEKNPALLQIDKVNGQDPEQAKKRPRFEDLTPLFPDQQLRLERADDPLNMTARIIDLISPIGKGQRGMIVSPPKAGKTTVMKQIAQSIEANDPDVKLIVLLVDERPEEVTDMRRSIQGEVVASTFDRPSEEHSQVAELTIERAKRLVEVGEDVVIILDGITRLARAYNMSGPASGRLMSGGLDSAALYPPKKFFGAARNIEEGGSLTILATALVDTGSKMDEVIFEEFKGTGNMELRLDRRLAERRVYPAIDVDASSTRHEELLFERKQLQQVWKLRRVLSGLASGDQDRPTGAGLELLIDRMKTFKSNDEFLAEVAKASSMSM